MLAKKPAKKKVSPTNETTRNILSYLFKISVFAYRQNVLPVPMVRKGVFTGFRPGSKSGVTDIVGIIPRAFLQRLHPNQRWPFGIALFIEVKTGRDSLRPEQLGFIKNALDSGAIVLVVKDFEDFLNQWEALDFIKPMQE